MSNKQVKNRSDTKVTVPINAEIIKYIKNSQFTILQDLIVYEMNNLTQASKQNVTDFFSSTGFSGVFDSTRYSQSKLSTKECLKVSLKRFTPLTNILLFSLLNLF